MLSEVLIRPAVLQDAEGTRRVLVETWHDTYDPLLGVEKVTEITGRWHAIEALVEQIGLPAAASFLVAEHLGQLIGHAFARELKPDVLFCPGSTYCRSGSGRAWAGASWRLCWIGTRMLLGCASMLKLRTEREWPSIAGTRSLWWTRRRRGACARCGWRRP